MKQVFIKKGDALIGKVPAPIASDDEILVQVAYSCISAGTELAGIEASGKPLIKKALDKPAHIKKVLESIRTSGIKDTIAKVQSRVEAKNPIGYSASGIVLETGKNIRNFKPGERVACAGAGIANHAEFITVPENLTVKVPDRLSLKEASTVTLGSIAMQGIRRCRPGLGENIAVIGLGILGQLTIQMLKASGCRVTGIDIDQFRIDKALSLGLDIGLNPEKTNIINEVISNTNGYGPDSVIITAASKSSRVINEAMEMCRRKGKVIIVGAVNLNLEREEFYKKELDLLISTSYGPGRYDERYEKKGFDYPYSYIRWTENRNMKEYLQLLTDKKIKIESLIEKVYKLEDASRAYEGLRTIHPKPMIVLLEYDKEIELERKVITNDQYLKDDRIKIGFIGVGGFAKNVHLPNVRKMDSIYKIGAICCKTGSNAESIAKEFNAGYATTDYKEILADPGIDMVIISTRHDLHAGIAIEAANAKKVIFVEKPMALNSNELAELYSVIEKMKTPFTVGFNRRFSPFSKKIKKLIDKRINPIIVNYRMNAGFIPKEHWVQTEEGGGRNIGEACHIYDLFNYFTDCKVQQVKAMSIDPGTEQFMSNDNFTAAIKYEDGSICNLIYTALGSSLVPKEQMDLYFDNKIIRMDDYKELEIFGLKEKGISLKVQNKGQFEELYEFGDNLKKHGIGQTIPLWQLIQATETSFEVEKQLTQI